MMHGIIARQAYFGAGEGPGVLLRTLLQLCLVHVLSILCRVPLRKWVLGVDLTVGL